MVLLIRKKSLKLNKKPRRKLYIQSVKKPYKLDEKTRKKSRRSQLMKNPLNSIKKQEKKPIICCFVYCFVGVEKPPKPS